MANIEYIINSQYNYTNYYLQYIKVQKNNRVSLKKNFKNFFFPRQKKEEKSQIFMINLHSQYCNYVSYIQYIKLKNSSHINNI